MPQADRHSEDLAAYLLGALDERPAAELERHLESCPDCREQLEWLRPAADLLPLGVARVEPPRRLRGAVLAAARRQPDPPSAAGARRRLRPRLAAALATLALLGGAVAGYALRAGGTSGGAAQSTPSMLSASGRAPGLTATLTRHGDSGMLRLAHLHSMPPGRVLEAWAKRGGRMVPVGGLFLPDRGGRAMMMIPGIAGVDAVMVTAEPRGGSAHPTSAPMVTLTLPQ